MPELTKSHHTKSIEIRFIGPIEKRDQAIESLKPLGFVDTSEEYVSWRELFPEYSDEEMPGSCLGGHVSRRESPRSNWPT